MGTTKSRYPAGIMRTRRGWQIISAGVCRGLRQSRASAQEEADRINNLYDEECEMFCRLAEASTQVARPVGFLRPGPGESHVAHFVPMARFDCPWLSSLLASAGFHQDSDGVWRDGNIRVTMGGDTGPWSGTPNTVYQTQPGVFVRVYRFGAGIYPLVGRNLYWDGSEWVEGDIKSLRESAWEAIGGTVVSPRPL